MSGYSMLGSALAKPANALIVGGGIGGLSAALAMQRIHQPTTVFEKAPELTEIGAGLQCSPNATRRLHHWGLQPELARIAAFPQALQVRSATDGAALGTLPLGADMLARYGAPYACVHRADLHTMLLKAARSEGAQILTAQSIQAYEIKPTPSNTVALHTDQAQYEGALIVGADGARSVVRQQCLNDGNPSRAGQVVYRALIAQQDLPAALRTNNITVWLGPHLHVVSYPVRGGEVLNVAAIVQGRLEDDVGTWDQAIHTQAVRAALRQMCGDLKALIEPLSDWRAWNVYDRKPLRSAQQMAQGRVALLGDAAHPMRPYMAQGAAMAIEDAHALAQALSQHGAVELALQAYAQARWARNARVQARATRNGQLFHAQGILRQGRDWGMRVLGARLLDVPWLYSG